MSELSNKREIGGSTALTIIETLLEGYLSKKSINEATEMLSEKVGKEVVGSIPEELEIYNLVESLGDTIIKLSKTEIKEKAVEEEELLSMIPEFLRKCIYSTPPKEHSALREEQPKDEKSALEDLLNNLSIDKLNKNLKIIPISKENIDNLIKYFK